MAVDYDNFAFPKGRVKALDKQDKQAALEAQDKKESAKAKQRAGGRCEVIEVPGTSRLKALAYVRCHDKDSETHHLKGGIGRRNRGDSILASQKIRVCKKCHAAITANILKPTTAEHDANTVRYWRAK